MSNFIIFFLFVIVCIQFFYLSKANEKIARYKKNIINKTEQLNRFHDVFSLHPKLTKIMKPFFYYVIKGGVYSDASYEVLMEFDQFKQKTINEYSSKNPSTVDTQNHIN